jgi:hypothetical protein
MSGSWATDMPVQMGRYLNILRVRYVVKRFDGCITAQQTFTNSASACFRGAEISDQLLLYVGSEPGLGRRGAEASLSALQ